jgi:hypothetical protein
LLLVAVIGVWGVVGYKIIIGLSPEDITAVQQDNYEMTFIPKAKVEVDTFSIQILDRDPFLGTLIRKKNNISNNSNVLANKIALDSLPRISYNGMVKNQNASNQVFVINIDNNQYLLKKGQMAESVKLIVGNNQEIIVRVNNKNYTIKRY